VRLPPFSGIAPPGFFHDPSTHGAGSGAVGTVVLTGVACAPTRLVPTLPGVA